MGPIKQYCEMVQSTICHMSHAMFASRTLIPDEESVNRIRFREIEDFWKQNWLKG